MTRHDWLGPLAGILCAVSLLSAQKTPELLLSPRSTLAGEPRIAATGSSVYAAWVDRRNGEFDIFFNRSHDRGNTWLDTDLRLDTDAPGASLSGIVDIAVAGATVYVLWLDDRSGEQGIYLNRSLDGGDHWLPSDIRVDHGAHIRGGDTGPPRLAVSGPHVYVAWSDLRNKREPDVYFNRSLDAGATWLSADVRLDTDAVGAARSTGVRLAASGSHVYAAWTDRRNGGGDVFFNRSSDGGTSWLPIDQRLDTDVPGAGFSTLSEIAASGSAVYVTWGDDRNSSSGRYDVYFNRSLDSGATWLPAEVRLDTDPPGAANSGSGRIAVSGTAVYVTWPDSRNSTQADYDIYFNRSMDAGATWLSADVRLDTDSPGGRAGNPEIAAAGAEVYVVWTDNRRTLNALSDVHMNYSLDHGVTWLARDVRLDTGATGFADGTVVAAADGHAYAAWHDDRSGSFATYFNIPFGVQPYGSAKPGGGNVTPRLETTDFPLVGRTADLDVSHASANAVGALLVGGSSSKVAVPVLDGTLLVRPLFTVPLALDGSGTATVPLTIPATFLAGTNVNFQAVLADAGATHGFSHTAAIEMWIGR